MTLSELHNWHNHERRKYLGRLQPLTKYSGAVRSRYISMAKFHEDAILLLRSIGSESTQPEEKCHAIK